MSRSGLAAFFALAMAWPVAASAQQPPSAGSSGSGSTGDTLIPVDPPASTTQPSNPSTPTVDPSKDQQKLTQQGNVRPLNDGTIAARPSEVFSEDWWSHTRPIVELHGYFRTRGEVYHNFFLGRHSGPGTNDNTNLWNPPLDHTYGDIAGAHHPVTLCNDPDPSGRFGDCIDKTQSSANLRLRLNPEIHISDNLRIMTQVDLLDNLVLGSTPDAYAIKPSAKGTSGYSPYGYNGYAPLGFFSTTQGSPTSGVNSYKNSINVNRAWAEYLTPLGQIRFGRMPNQWGLGMLYNAGDGIDQDYQQNIDRIMFVTGLKSLDLYAGGMWDFVSSGGTSASPYDVYGGQPYNTSNLTNVDQWSAFVAHRTNPETERLKLARNEFVINGGLYASYRKQLLDVTAGETPLTVDAVNTPNNGLERRGASAFTPDIWIQFLYQKFRFEAEVASMWGSIENSPARSDVNNAIKIRQFGFAAQTELKAVEDKLRVKFDAGWASGDPNIEGLAPGNNGLQVRKSEGPISTFRFSPAYNVDQIFFRRILTRVEGAYYFKPGVEYDFLRNPGGQKFGGGANIVWSRASEFVQAPGNKRDLGVELDLQVYYQSKDGTLNDDPTKMGGFYAALQYGVFFPLGGLDYLPGVRGDLEGTQPKLDNYDLSTAQIVRLLLGVMF